LLLLALEVTIFVWQLQIEASVRTLIRRMSMDNPLWGAPRIHGELVKLGFEVAQSSLPNDRRVLTSLYNEV